MTRLCYVILNKKAERPEGSGLHANLTLVIFYPISFEFEFDWLFNVTCNDISLIYVTANICAGGTKKKFDLRSGSQHHRHFVGFFYVPVQAQTWGHPFNTIIPRNHPIKSPFTKRWGYGGHLVDLTTGSSRGFIQSETA